MSTKKLEDLFYSAHNFSFKLRITFTGNKIYKEKHNYYNIEYKKIKNNYILNYGYFYINIT